MVTASNLLASAALRQGLFFRSLPDFGAERSGAPILAYTRVSQNPIYDQAPVIAPDVVVVMDFTLIGKVDLLGGLKGEGVLVVNSTQSPQGVREALEFKAGRLCIVDATGLAMTYLKRNIPNGPILGALVRATGVVSKESMVSAIEADLSGRFRREIVEANLQAFERGYEEALLD